MPSRPTDPRDVAAYLSTLDARLRSVETQRLLLPDGTEPVETFENGRPLGVTRYINWGRNIKATLEDEQFVRVDAIVPGNGWDAIVDGDADTDTDLLTPIFSGIGEACQWLSDEGFGAAAIAVRAFSGTYTETANWDMPNHCHLFGVRGGNSVPDADWVVSWDWNEFRPDTTTDSCHVVNFDEVSCGRMTSGGTLRPWNYLINENTFWTLGNLTGVTPTPLATYVWATQSTFEMLGNGTGQIATSYGEFASCDFEIRPVSGGTHTFFPAGTELMMSNCGVRKATGGTGNWQLPTRFNISCSQREGRNPTSGGAGTVAITIPASSNGRLECYESILGGYSVTNASAVEKVALKGTFTAITLAAPKSEASSGAPWIIDAHSSGSVDITGPAIMNLSVRGGANALTLRGSGLSGNVSIHDAAQASGAALRFLSALNAQIEVAANPGALSGTAVPISFDAGSLRNTVIFGARSLWPNTYTDAGTNNRVLPETAAPSGGIAPANADYLVGTANGDLSGEIVVGATPGGELGGTWASPTVDATHSGSAHADFIAKALAAAKGDIFTATGNDTPAILTVGTDTFVLIANSATATGLEWVDITSLLGATAGWGSITNVTTDRAYDADLVTLFELADVLGTLIADLIAQGVLAT